MRISDLRSIHTISICVSLVVTAMWTLAGAAKEQAQQRFEGQANVTVVELVTVAVDAQGRPVAGLVPDDFSVLEDGEPVRVVGLDGGPAAVTPTGFDVAALDGGGVDQQWRVMVYIATELAGRFDLPELIELAAEQAEELVAIGPVDLVLADPDPWLVVEGVRRAADLREALDRIGEHKHGRSTVDLIRQRFARELSPDVGFQSGRIVNESAMLKVARAKASIRQETAIVESQLNRMTSFIAGRPIDDRGVMIWLTGGFDINPAEFYVPFVSQIDPLLGRTMQMEFEAQGLADDVGRLIHSALSKGWTILPFSRARSSDHLWGAEVGGSGRVQHMTGTGANTIESQASDFRQIAPFYPLEMAAQATGGELVMRDDRFVPALDRVTGAYLLSYEVGRSLDGRLHRVEVRCSRPNVEIRTKRAVAAGTVAEVAANRAILLIGESGAQGDLSLGASIREVEKSGKKEMIGLLSVVFDFGELAEVISQAGAGRVRLTLAIEREDDSPFVVHRELEIDAGSSATAFIHETRLRWPRSSRRMVVVAEDLATGIWGAYGLALSP